jgi:hypothetical protein
MKRNDPLEKLLRAAARAEREAASEELAMPFGWETRVLAAARKSRDQFVFLPLFRGALACAAALAILCAGFSLSRREQPDVYDYTMNYSIAAAYFK